MRIHITPQVGVDLPLSVAYVRSIDDILLEEGGGGVTEGEYATVPSPIGINTWVEMTEFDGSEVPRRFLVPSSGEGRMRFGYPSSGMVTGGTSTPTFTWADFNSVERGLDGDAASDDQVALSFQLPHAGAAPRPGTNDDDYRNRIVDSSTVSFGASTTNRLLISVDNEVGLASLFPVQPLRVDIIRPTIATTGQIIKLNEPIPLPGPP